MAAVRVLTATHINHSKVQRRLIRAGYAVIAGADGFRASRHGRWDAVDVTTTQVRGLPPWLVESAKPLLGFPPRSGITCSFDGAVIRSDAWSTVVDIARAVAAIVPLAILDDCAGTIYLVHPNRGLIGREEYEAVSPGMSTGELLRRFIGNR